MATCKTGAALGGDGPHVSANHRVPFGGASWAQEAFQMGPRGAEQGEGLGSSTVCPRTKSSFCFLKTQGQVQLASIPLSTCEVWRAASGVGW